MRIEFRPVGDSTELARLADFLWKQDLGYPGYRKIWVPKAIGEIESERKQALVAWYDGRIVGDLIWHQLVPGVNEWRNLRVDEELRGRHFATFMMKQALAEITGDVIADVRASETGVISSLYRCGLRPLKVARLYDEQEDIVFAKSDGEISKYFGV